MESAREEELKDREANERHWESEKVDLLQMRDDLKGQVQRAEEDLRREQESRRTAEEETRRLRAAMQAVSVPKA